MRQGKVKDSGWGSDDEAAALPEAEAAPAPAPKQTARKQVASAFDLLQGSDDDPGEVASAADDGSDAEMNGAASEPDSAAHSDSDSDLGEQVMRCQFACIQHLPLGSALFLLCTATQCKRACPSLYTGYLATAVHCLWVSAPGSHTIAAHHCDTVCTLAGWPCGCRGHLGQGTSQG